MAGVEVKPGEGFSLGTLLGIRLETGDSISTMLVEIEEISEVSSKEHNLERALDRMDAEWSGVALECSAYRDSATYILKGIEETQLLIDDHIMKTQTIKGSPYLKPIEARVLEWERVLKRVQATLDEWLKCQVAWMYLCPIFGSDDIMQQMPVEGRAVRACPFPLPSRVAAEGSSCGPWSGVKWSPAPALPLQFKAVDAVWRGVMKAALSVTSALQILSSEENFPKLLKANVSMDQIQKGLNEYLETKRLAFPRFFFLSNDEMLAILSETTDPLRVQPYLKKVFEAIHRLEFQADLKVTAMLSEEKERVPLTQPVDTLAAGGLVERWLIDVESAMRVSVKSSIAQAVASYTSKVRGRCSSRCASRAASASPAPQSPPAPSDTARQCRSRPRREWRGSRSGPGRRCWRRRRCTGRRRRSMRCARRVPPGSRGTRRSARRSCRRWWSA